MQVPPKAVGTVAQAHKQASASCDAAGLNNRWSMTDAATANELPRMLNGDPHNKAKGKCC